MTSDSITEQAARAEAVETGAPAIQLLACTRCGVLLWDIEAHYAHAHPDDALAHQAPATEDEAAGIVEAALALVGEAWDDGNATGLDGYTGPGRGAGEIDSEAVHRRTRMVLKADRLLTKPRGEASR